MVWGRLDIVRLVDSRPDSPSVDDPSRAASVCVPMFRHLRLFRPFQVLTLSSVASGALYSNTGSGGSTNGTIREWARFTEE